MARSNLALFSLVLFSLALAGCPSSTTPGSDVPIERLGAQYGNVTCEVIRDCYGDAIVALISGATTQAACEMRAEAGYLNAALPRYQAAIAMGTMSYDATQAGACIDALRAEGCAVVSARTPPECDRLFVGHVATGGACALDEECQGDAYCSITAACPGTCQAYGGSGAACTRDQACQSGLRCGNGTCQAPGGVGASCQGTTGVECAGGLICQGGSTTRTGTCASVDAVFVGTMGAACNPQNGQLCMDGLSCIVASATSQTCGTGGLSVGTACTLALPDQCAPGSYCEGPSLTALPPVFTGTCRALPIDGMPCATVVAGQSCADGAVCGASDRACHQVHANGGSCIDDSGCYSGLCRSGTCAVPTYCPS